MFTILVDNNGLDEDWTVGSDGMKNPRELRPLIVKLLLTVKTRDRDPY